MDPEAAAGMYLAHYVKAVRIGNLDHNLSYRIGNYVDKELKWIGERKLEKYNGNLNLHFLLLH